MSTLVQRLMQQLPQQVAHEAYKYLREHARPEDTTERRSVGDYMDGDWTRPVGACRFRNYQGWTFRRNVILGCISRRIGLAAGPCTRCEPYADGDHNHNAKDQNNLLVIAHLNAPALAGYVSPSIPQTLAEAA